MAEDKVIYNGRVWNVDKHLADGAVRLRSPDDGSTVEIPNQTYEALERIFDEPPPAA
jgi:hypothetical protein